MRHYVVDLTDNNITKYVSFKLPTFLEYVRTNIHVRVQPKTK